VEFPAEMLRPEVFDLAGSGNPSALFLPVGAESKCLEVSDQD